MKYKLIIFSVLAALTVRIFFISVYKVPTQTMAPVILSGDYVLASQVAYGFKLPVNSKVYFKSLPKEGDLVVYTAAGKTFIKRIMATAGDEVEFFQSELSVNSKKCEYVNSKPNSSGTHHTVDEKCGLITHSVVRAVDSSAVSVLPRITLTEGQFLAVADNRSPDVNSVSIEVINYDQIVGKPLLIWMSYSSTQDFISQTNGLRWNRILTIPQ